MNLGKKLVVSLCVAGALTLSAAPFAAAEATQETKQSAEVNAQHRSQTLGGLHSSSKQTVRTNPATRRIAVAQSTAAPKSFSERIQAILHPPVPARPDFSNMEPDSILGHPVATQEQCVRYLLSVNPRPAIAVTPERLVSYYYEEGEREGVRPDVAFAQALKETGYFSYGGTVTPDQNNYCGLGTTSTTVKGAYFGSSQLGVRAHIQHLLAYASTHPPKAPIVDPRYDLVRSVYGDNTLGHWEDLNGRWAVPGYTYGQSILELFNNILHE